MRMQICKNLVDVFGHSNIDVLYITNVENYDHTVTFVDEGTRDPLVVLHIDRVDEADGLIGEMECIRTDYKRIKDIRKCPRCDGKHTGVRFAPFHTSVNLMADDIGISILTWAICPSTGEPILEGELDDD